MLMVTENLIVTNSGVVFTVNITIPHYGVAAFDTLSTESLPTNGAFHGSRFLGRVETPMLEAVNYHLYEPSTFQTHLRLESYFDTLISNTLYSCCIVIFLVYWLLYILNLI